MRLPGARTEKSHSFYLIIYQVFKSVFSTENETLRLFSQKKLFHVRENYYPLDSIKEGADEPVANDTCDVTYESNPGDVSCFLMSVIQSQCQDITVIILIQQ